MFYRKIRQNPILIVKAPELPAKPSRVLAEGFVDDWKALHIRLKQHAWPHGWLRFGTRDYMGFRGLGCRV